MTQQFINLEAENLNYTVKHRKEEKTVLNGINCKFSSGRLIGILGPSGSGKTTLLNCLSGYQYENARASALKLNGFDVDFSYLRTISSLVTQEIHLNDLLTLEENMRFAADFKLGNKHHTRNSKQKIISDLQFSFALNESADCKTGNLSGGERKRLAIALEMINDPDIVFIDEPTTGLDIVKSGQILEYLKGLALKGKMVVATVHQATATHFEMFDLVYILGEGRCVYQGPPKQLVPYLEQLDLPCNIYHNPADYIIELCCGDFGGDKLELLVRASQNGLNYNGSYPFIDYKNKENKRALPETKIMENKSWFYNFSVLFKRELKKATRNLASTYLRTFGTLLIAICIGVFFMDTGNDASKVIFVYNMVLCILANLVFCGLIVTLVVIPLEINVIKREVYNNYYTVGQYYLTTTLLDLPISLFCFSTSSGLIYYMSGQPLEAQRIQMYLTIAILIGCLLQSIGFFLGTMLNLSDAVFTGIIMQVPMLSLSGFGILFSHLPPYFHHLSKILYARQSVEGILIAFWGFNRENLPCHEETKYCYYKNVGKFLTEIGVQEENYFWDVTFLICWYIFIRTVTNFTLRWKVFSQK